MQALPNPWLACVTALRQFGLAACDPDGLLDWGLGLVHACVASTYAVWMITQVMDKSNKCYLLDDNARFSLLHMTTEPENLASRLRFAREKKGLSQEQLGALAGVTQVTIQHLESGRNKTSKKIVDIARALGLSAEWLTHGTDRERTLKIRHQEELEPSSTITANAELIGMMSPWDSSTPLAQDEVAIPLYKEVEMAGGSGATEVIEVPGRLLRFARSTLREAGVDEENAACATIRGTSMERLIMDGATIGIDKGTVSIEDGEIYAFDHDGMLRVKYLYRLPGGGLRIRSENDDEYPDEVLSPDDAARIRILGWVFWWSTVRRRRGLRLAK